MPLANVCVAKINNNNMVTIFLMRLNFAAKLIKKVGCTW